MMENHLIQNSCKHEQKVKKEKIDKEQRELLQKIKTTYEELGKLVFEYEYLYSLEKELCFMPLSNLLDILC